MSNTNWRLNIKKKKKKASCPIAWKSTREIANYFIVIFFSLHSLKTEQWCHGINVILNVHCVHKSHDLFLSVFIVSTEQTARTCIWTHSAVTHSDADTVVHPRKHISSTKMQKTSYVTCKWRKVLQWQNIITFFFWFVLLVLNPARNMIFAMITVTSNMQHSISLLLSVRTWPVI